MADTTDERIARLERALQMAKETPDTLRIAEIRTELEQRALERPALVAARQSWKVVHESLRAEAEELRLRQIKAQRDSRRDSGRVDDFDDNTRLLREELELLEERQAGYDRAARAPVVRSLPHAQPS